MSTFETIIIILCCYLLIFFTINLFILKFDEITGVIVNITSYILEKLSYLADNYTFSTAYREYSTDVAETNSVSQTQQSLESLPDQKDLSKAESEKLEILANSIAVKIKDDYF